MKSITEYLSTFIPPILTIEGVDYQFQLFINHPHYDIRIGYIGIDNPDLFEYLTENINSDEDLLDSLRELKVSLKINNLLTGDYDTEEGYSKHKYEEWINNQGK